MPAYDPNTQLLLSLFFLALIAVATSYYAQRKGRNPLSWFLISLLLGIIAPAILFFLPSLKREEIDDNLLTPPISPPFPQSEEKSGQTIDTVPFPLEEDKLWYYLDQNHQQYGPVSLVALKDLWNTGQLVLNSYVWSEGMGQWERVENLPHLKTSLKTFHP